METLVSHLRINRILPALVVTALLAGAGIRPAAADEFEDMTRMVGLMQNFMVLMDSVYNAASNPEHAALIEMNTMEDLYKELGQPNKVIAVYQDILKASTNPTVRRLTYMRLADALKNAGEQSAAIEVLRDALDESIQAANEAARRR